jgi:ELWxxDGT repeat protein
MKRLFIILILGSFGANAQLSLVQDIYPGSQSSSPIWLTSFNNRLVFFAKDSLHGVELWSYNGSTAPSLVADIYPGTNGSSGPPVLLWRKMVAINNILYFHADDSVHGRELFKWNGVTQPVIAKDVFPGSGGASSYPDYLVAHNNVLFFTATMQNYGKELVAYDPVADTVVLAADIYPGTTGSSVAYTVVFNNKIYFSAKNASIGTELFEYDPVTKMLNSFNIAAGTKNSNPESLVVIGSKLYFSADDSVYGRELYAFDGINPPVRLTDMWPGNGHGVNSYAVANVIGGLNGMVYFFGTTNASGTQLFRHDTSSGQTTLVYKLTILGPKTGYGLTNYADKLYFGATTLVNGIELWSYDGVHDPVIAADINTGGSASTPTGFTVFNGGLYFAATTTTGGTELYKFLDTTSTIQNVGFNGDVTVYPNPTTDKLNIELSLKATEKLIIKLTDITGREVYATGSTNYPAAKTTVVIPMKSLSTGTYFYHVRNEQGRTYMSGKVVKE